MWMPWRPHRDGRASWPVVLRESFQEPTIVLRPLRPSDEQEWQRVRQANTAHVQPWEPTLPPGADPGGPVSFRQFVRDLDQEARADRALPWCLDVGGHIVGHVPVFGIVRAAQQSGAVGYWLDAGPSGRPVCTASRSTSAATTCGRWRWSSGSGCETRGCASASCTSTASGATTAPSQ